MIRYVKRKSIDIKKYDACIEHAQNTRIYAFSWYLDIVADNWDALILDDYKAVMPLPWRSKYLIKYVYTPCWTQQLGVFSSDVINKELINNFIFSIPKKFKKVTLNLNNFNAIQSENSTLKTNYILTLDKSYKELFQKYKYMRRRRKKNLDTHKINISTTDNFQQIITLFMSQKQKEVNLKALDYNRLNSLINYMIKEKKVDVIVAKNTDNELLGGAIFLKDAKRITYLFSSVSKEGRDEQVMTYIIDYIIEKYSNSTFTLDFEGSMIPGIAFFFKSFGAQKEEYATFYRKLFS